jgi:hypothetical protein
MAVYAFITLSIFSSTNHYRKDGLCLAQNDLPGAFDRAHGKGHSLPCAYDTPHGSDKRTVQTSLPCVVSRAHDKDIFVVRQTGAHGKEARALAPPVARRTAGADTNGR